MSSNSNRRPQFSLTRLFIRGLAHWQRRRAMEQLAALDDRELWDIGLTRNDIPRAVQGLFRDK